MSKVGSAIAGVAASAAVLVGGYGLEAIEGNQERSDKAACADLFEGKARTECIDDVGKDYDDTYLPEILAFTGVVGIIGCGYIGYKALKDEVGTTGIVEDHM